MPWGIGLRTPLVNFNLIPNDVLVELVCLLNDIVDKSGLDALRALLRTCSSSFMLYSSLVEVDTWAMLLVFFSYSIFVSMLNHFPAPGRVELVLFVDCAIIKTTAS